MEHPADIGRTCPLTPHNFRSYCLRMTKSEYLTAYERNRQNRTDDIDGSKQGKSEIMRPAFRCPLV